MNVYAVPPKHMTPWLIDVFAAEINMLRFLNGVSTEEAFRLLFYSDYCFTALNPDTGGWSIPPYWGYDLICKENRLETRPAQIGYPFPRKERIRALVAYILVKYEDEGIRPDYLFEQLSGLGMFKTYTEGRPSFNKKVSQIIKDARKMLKEQPEDIFED